MMGHGVVAELESGLFGRRAFPRKRSLDGAPGAMVLIR